MLAKKYQSEIESIIKHQDGVYTLEFSCHKKFKYQPGQFLHIAIDKDYDGIGQWPESRCFSMQSNPSEKTIKITYSVKGAFTKKMEEQLQEGDNVWLKLPYGDLFSQDHSKENTVFIAGGTGVTPFLSLFTHETFKNYKNPHIYLGFKEEALHLYKEQFDSIKTINPSMKLTVFFETSTGLIDINRIYEEADKTSSFFISGPPAMIGAFKMNLFQKGIPSNQIKTDDWE